MQPSTDKPARGNSTALRRWGPIAAIVAVVAVVAAVVVFSGGDDDEPTEAASSGTTAGSGEHAEGAVSFTQAQEEGLDVTFPETCDEETGRVAIPYYFAPECFADVDDNGGATFRGVTADAIKVVVYVGPENDPVIDFITAAIANDDTNAEAKETMQGYVDLFNATYQLYGRQVELEFFDGTGIATDEVAARADAVAVADMEPFAVMGSPALTPAFTDELAARGIPCVGLCVGGGSPEWYEQRAPNVLTVTANSTQLRSHVAEFVEKQLAGRPAEYAGDPELQAQERAFAYLYIESSEESTIAADDFDANLAAAGIDLVERIPYTLDPARLQEQAASTIARMKASGVTTVLFSGDPVAPATFTREATAQEWFPEWVVAGSPLVDVTAFARTYDQEQWSHAMGVSTLTARARPEVGAGWVLYEWFNGEPPPAVDTYGVIYPSPATLFAGIQGAGPNLTPGTLRDGLFSGEPTATAISAQSISYGDHGRWDFTDYNGIDDATLIWWDPAATGPDEIAKEGEGMYRYVDGGARYLPGEWPTDPLPLFDPEGTVALLDELPADETPKDYPSPAG